MSEEPVEKVTSTYIYKANEPNEKHPDTVSAYLVQRLSGSAVVARITPLGLVDAADSDNDITIKSIKQGITMVGVWQPMGKNGFRRAVSEGKLTKRKATPNDKQ